MCTVDTSDLRPTHLKHPLRDDEIFLGHVIEMSAGTNYVFDAWLKTTIVNGRWAPMLQVWRGTHYQIMSDTLDRSYEFDGCVRDAMDKVIAYVLDNWWTLYNKCYPS